MTHYDEFGLSPTASVEEIQRAHRNLARLLHPDPIQDAELRRLAESQLKRVNHIYSILVDPVRRQKYNQQLTRRADVEMFARRRSWRATPWHASAAVAGLSLAFGFQGALWWSDAGNLRERVVYVDRAESGQLAPRITATREEAAQPLLADTRELRRMLNQVILERDQAVARLTSLRSAVPVAPAVSLAAARPLASAASPEPQSATGTASAVEANVEAQNVARPNLIGTWIYSAPGARTSPADQYPAEYIELLLTERESKLWGRYRARYKVPDRAMSPEVEFFFEGSPAGDRRYVWRGNGGGAGEVHLQLMSENTLSLDWFTSKLGRNPMLGSGTAVLVRRRPD